MKWLMTLMILVTVQSKAEVSHSHVESMIDQMVTKKVISAEEAAKAKLRMKSMSPDQWSQINQEANKIAARSPASAQTTSNNQIHEVKSIDLDSAQFKQIQEDVGKIVPQYKD